VGVKAGCEFGVETSPNITTLFFWDVPAAVYDVGKGCECVEGGEGPAWDVHDIRSR
jgi:hypothetical protein